MVTSSCTSGKKGIRVGGWEPAHAAPRYQSSNLNGSGHSGSLHSSPTALTARESIAVKSGSGSDDATLRKGGNAAESSSPDSSSASDAAINIWSSGRAPNEMAGPPLKEPVRSPGSSTACGLLEEWGAHGDSLGGFTPM